MKSITVEYLLDNDNWSEEEFENQLIKEFVITEDIIKDLIYPNIKLKEGDYLLEISSVKPTQYVKL